MSKKKVLLRGVFINRDTNGEGVLKVGTTLIRVSTVMGILYNKYDSLRKSYNKVIKNKVNDVKQGLYQTIYLTLTIMAEDVADAKAHLVLWRVP